MKARSLELEVPSNVKKKSPTNSAKLLNVDALQKNE